MTIVGVARDVRSAGLSEPVPAEIFILHDQLPMNSGGTERAMYVVLRTAGDPLSLAAPARRIVSPARLSNRPVLDVPPLFDDALGAAG